MEKYLCFFLIPFLLDFINCDYMLKIQNQCFEFTLEENDAANQFKSKLPLNISMSLNGYSPNYGLEYFQSNFWSRSFGNDHDEEFESGSIFAYMDNSLNIKFFYISNDNINLGKIKNPDEVIQLILDTRKKKIDIEFIVGNCLDKCISDAITSKECVCGSNTTCSVNQYCTNDGNCLEKCISDAITSKECLCGSNTTCSVNQYCTNDGNCLDQCENGVILPDGFCKCDNNICSKNQMCDGTNCSDITNCTVNSPAPNPVCICQDDICEEGKICTSDGSCIEPPTNIPTTIPTTVPADVLTTEPSTMSTDLFVETETSSEAAGDSNKDIENTSEESINTNEGKSDVSERTEAQSDEIGNTNEGTERTSEETRITNGETGSSYIISTTEINNSNYTTPNTIFTQTIPTINSQKTTLPSPISSIPNIKTTELIKVTIPSQINTTSIITNNPKIPTTNINENTNTVQLILLAISNLEMSVSSFTFYIYFVQIENFIITYPTSLKFTIMVIYNTYLRSLEEKEAKCYLNNSNVGSKIQYICEVETITSNIKQIKIEQKINFESSEKFDVIGSSPLFNLFKDNLLLIDKAYDQLLYKEIYILNNSTYYKYSKKEFNISGFIRDPQPKFKENYLILMISANYSTINATCIINNLTSNDYSLYCKVNESLEYDLKYATSIIDNNSILVINLESGFESEIIVDSQNKSLHRSNANTSKKNKSSIIAIVISIVMFIAIVITIILIIYFKKKNEKTKQETHGVTESTIEHCVSFSKN